MRYNRLGVCSTTDGHGSYAMLTPNLVRYVSMGSGLSHFTAMLCYYL